MPSRELHIMEEGAAFNRRPSKEFISDLENSTDEKKRFDVSNKAQIETRDLTRKSNHSGLDNGLILRDLCSTSHLYVPKSADIRTKILNIFKKFLPKFRMFYHSIVMWIFILTNKIRLRWQKESIWIWFRIFLQGARTKMCVKNFQWNTSFK